MNKIKSVVICVALTLFACKEVLSASVRIMPMGDSITYGDGSSSANSYRGTLKSLLDSGGFTNINFVGSLVSGDFIDNEHEGHPGAELARTGRSSTVLANAYNWLIANPADIVLLHAGINDFLQDDPPSASEVSQVIDEIQNANSNATVVLALILNGYGDKYYPELSTFNNSVNTMAQNRIVNGDDIIIVDMECGANFEYSSSSPDFTSYDNYKVHPSDIGYNKMATNWYSSVVKAVQHQSGIPYFYSSPFTNAVTPFLYTYEAGANGNPAPSYALDTAPAGMTINATTGLVQWSPVSGTNTVSVLASNVAGVATQSFNIVTVSYSLPVITSDAITNVVAETLYSYNAAATGIPPAAFILDLAPSNMTVNATNGLIEWTPSAAQFGTHAISLLASNSVGVATQSFDIVVAGTLPTITSDAVTKVMAETLYRYDAEASGIPIAEFSLDLAPSNMTVNATNGLVEWTPSAAQFGTHAISLLASNSVGVASQSFDVIVKGSAETIGIDFTGNLSGGHKLIAVADGDLMGVESQTNWNSTGEGVVSGSLYGLQGASGAYYVNVVTSWQFDNSGWSQNAVEGQNIPPAAPVPIYNPINKNHKLMGGFLWDDIPRSVTVSGLDSVLESDSTFDVLVYVDPWLAGSATEVSIGAESVVVQPVDYNDPGAEFDDALEDNLGNYVRFEDLSGSNLTVTVSPAPGESFCSLNGIQIVEVYGEAPTIVSTPVTSIVIGESYTYDVEAMGNADPLFELAIAPAGMTIDVVSGLLAWTPQTGQLGNNYVSLLASNVVGVATQSFDIVVAGTLPTITSDAITNVVAETLYSYDAEASGIPSASFILDLAPSNMTVNATNGLVEWTPSTAQFGTHAISLLASNTVGVATQSFDVVVAGTLPSITSEAVTNVVAEQLYSYDAAATGIPAAAFILDLAPSNMTVNATNGLVEWTPVAAQYGTHAISLLASNVVGVATQSFYIVVAGTLPEITSIEPVSVVVGDTYAYAVQANGVPSPQFMLGAAPVGMSINAFSGLVEWIPQSSQSGLSYVELIATNLQGTASQSFWISVVDVPVVEGLSIAGNQVGLDLSHLTTGLQARVERTLILTPPAWTNVGVITPITTMTNWTETVSNEWDSVFYRIIME